jgi:hypothetical protein
MVLIHPGGPQERAPTGAVIVRQPLTCLGPHAEWAADGHDKLLKYGFGLWAVRDKFSRKWLAIWALPNNRIGIVVAYLWLSLVRDLKGEFHYYN